MLPLWLQEFDTLQQYLRSLFDCDCISVDRLRLSQEPIVQESVRLLTSYGRKIMELSEQATFQHRNQHYLARRPVEQELAAVYRALVGEYAQLPAYEQMIRAITEKLQEDRKSIWNKFSMPESRVLERREEHEERSTLKEEERKSLKQEQKNMRASKGKSRVVSKNGAVKQALQIKRYLDGEQDAIREFFAKLGRMLEMQKVPVGNLEQQALKFTRVNEENGSDRISDLVRTSTETHTRNINNLSNLVQLLHDTLQRRLKTQGQAEGRLTTFLQEARRMEEVYSYTLSKMLQRLSLAKDALSCGVSAERHLESLEEITRKLYGLYPSQESMQPLTIRAKSEGKTYGVQVNMGKPQQERKMGSDAFRLQVRVNECLDRFDKANKHRKTFEIKEIEKLMETIRQVLPVKQQRGEADAAYQQEFRGLMELQEKREKEAVDGLTKKLKKAEKRAVELEALVEELKHQSVVTSEEWEQERKKLSKKAEGQHSELKKLAKQKAALDSNLSQYIQDIERMRQEVRRQGEEEGRLRRALEREVSDLNEECETLRQKLKTFSDEHKVERQEIAAERALYRQKIQVTEEQLESQRELSAGLRINLETALGQHREARVQLAEMSKIYEQKIRELDGVIQHLRELQQLKQAQEAAILDLQTTVHQHQEHSQELQKQLQNQEEKNRHLIEQRNALLGQVQHWKQEGNLTDADLKQLREEVEKVSRAYIDSEEQLDNTRRQLACLAQEREKLFRERLRLNRLVQDLQTQTAALKTKQQANQLSERDLRDEYYQTAQQNKRLQRELQEVRKDTGRIRKQLQEQREERAKCQRELRELRQEQQGKKQAENAEQGRRRLQVENLRMQLRRKTEQAEKQQANYEEKLSLLQQKIKEMEEFAGQKHLLSRLMHSHQTQ